MELKTDGGIYLTKEEYRKSVKKVMDRQCAEATVAMFAVSISEDEKVTKAAHGAVRDALKLQLQVLVNMERELFGEPDKKDEETEKDD